MKPPYCLVMVVFTTGVLCAVAGLVALATGSDNLGWALLGVALTAGFCISPARNAVNRREHGDLLARYATRPIAQVSKDSARALALRTTIAIAILAAVSAWAQQTPNDDAAIARQACAPPLVAGAEC